VVERLWRSNGGELPRWSAVAQGALAAPCEREGREGRIQLKKHQAMADLTVEGEEQHGRGSDVGSLSLLRHWWLDEEGVRWGGGVSALLEKEEKWGGRERGAVMGRCPF
jgi:hypothetical protein